MGYNIGGWLIFSGCKIRVLGERERTELGLRDSSVNTKYAVLTAPVVFPKVKTGNRKTTR